MKELLIAEGFDSIELHIWDDEKAILLSIVVDDDNEVGFVIEPENAIRLARCLNKYALQLLDGETYPDGKEDPADG